MAMSMGFLAWSAPVQAQTNQNADAVYDGWLRAYLIRSGGKTYFANNLVDRSMAFMWGQAYDIAAVEDAYDRTKSADRKQLVSDLLNTFIQKNTTDLSWDSWNDDVAWAAIALARGYQITGNRTFLDASKKAWDMAYDRGWDSKWGGGIYENMANKGDKGGLSNWTFVMAGADIYESTKDVGYLNKSKSIYAWARSRIFDTTTGRVYEGVDDNGKRGDDNVYNSGLLINAAASLYKITGDKTYYNDAILAADHVIKRFPIMIDDHPANGGFGGEQFFRGLSKFATQNKLWGKYWQWFHDNATTAWNNRRTDYNVTWNKFNKATPATTNFWAMEVLSSVVIQVTTPEKADSPPVTDPNPPAPTNNPIAGAHSIVSALNGIVIDNGNTKTNGAGTILWSANGGAQQKWNFVQNSDTSWTITNQQSNLVLEDPGYAMANGVQVAQWTANGGDNQSWWVDKQGDGSYKIWNKASRRALDSSSSSNNGQPLVQWEWHDAVQQRWLLK